MAVRQSDVDFRYEVQKGDLEDVRRLAESTGFFREDEVDVAVELVEDRVRKGEASEYRFVFARAMDRTVGYACYGPIACTLGSFDLYWVVVATGAQGQGIGRRLLQEAERLAAERGGRRIYADTSGRPQYASTRAFYESCGYRVAATLEAFYDRDDDKVVYVKRL